MGSPQDIAELKILREEKARLMDDVDRYATNKTWEEAGIDVGGVAGTISQLVMVFKSAGGVNNGYEIAQVALLSVSVALQVALLFIFLFQGNMNIEKLGELNPDTGRYEAGPTKTRQQNRLKNTNTAAMALTLVIVLINIAISALTSEQT